MALQHGCVAVNDASVAALEDQLKRVPGLPLIAAERIVDMRPFADAADMRSRVNALAANPKQCVGKNTLKS